MHSPLSKAFAVLAAITSVKAAVVDIYWNITRTTANPDGLFDKTYAIGINNSWPAPPIVLTQGDVLRMHAINGLETVTSLHHHGMYFNKTSFYDGATAITQCGIPPGETLVYEVDTTNQVGTYWVHGHTPGQTIDGLRAPVIILPRNTTGQPAYDEDYHVLLSDWYHPSHQSLNDRFVSKANPGGAEPVPESALIYFVKYPEGRYLPGFNENASLPLVPGRTYRLRVSNVGGFAMFFFKIDGHQMRVIEVDGTDVEPYLVDSLTVTVAQRYSVLVTALNTTDRNYPIQANFDSDMFDVIPDGLPLNYSAVARYSETTPVAAPIDFDPAWYASTNDLVFVPTEPEPVMIPTRQIELNVFFDTFKNGVNRAAFNNITFIPPITPTIMTVNSMGADATDMSIYGRQTHALLLKHMEVIELRVVNWDAGKHPFHLHGHKFQIAGKQDDVTVDPAEIDNSQANPIRRDVVQIPSMGSATLRFVADNPGVWMFHCHIDWHLNSGLATVFIAAPELIQQNPPPQIMIDQCSAQGISPTGNAAGIMSLTNLRGAPYGPFPQDPGFHAAGAGAIFGCVLSALLGIATIIWYAMGSYDAEHVEWEENQKQISKEMGFMKRTFGGGGGRAAA